MSLLYEGRGLTRRYGERVALHLPELVVRRGRVLALTGPNGSGKSTLLRMLAFLEPPDAGSLTFHGTPGTPPRLEATLLLQEPYLLKRSVFENVAYGLRARGRIQGLPEVVRESLAAVGFAPGQMERRLWRELSGGERQRVALAARLVLQPQALLLDEPTSNLDTRSAEAIHGAVRQAVLAGTTVVIASHDKVWLDELEADTLRLGEPS